MTLVIGRAALRSAFGFAILAMPSAVLAGDGEGGLEDIVVTAQRQSQNLQNVPISVSTVTADQAARSGVTGIANLATVTPGLLITTSQRTPQIFIRGIGSQNTTPGDESSVSIYVDGVYRPSAYGNLFSFNNIERIEVLKGPQGTLFGRNATGGLIHVVTRDPSQELTAEGQLSYSSFNTVEGALYLSAGNDVIAGDISLYRIHQDDGFGHNLTNGAEIGRQEEWAVRSKWLLTPSDVDRFTLALDYGKNTSDLGLYRSPLPGVVMTGGAKNTGTIFDAISNPITAGDREWISRSASLKYERELGEAHLSLMGAVGRQSASYSFDSDGTPLLLVQPTVSNSTDYAQAELLLSGTSGRLDWTTGIFLLSSKTKLHQITNSINPINATVTTGEQQIRSAAGFLDLTYAFTDSTKLTLGGRYTQDERKFEAEITTRPGYVGANGATYPVGTTLFSRNEKISWGRFSGRVVLNQELGDRVLGYLSYNRGFKSGVFNMSIPAQPVVNPETINAYEAGLKSEWFNHTLRLNVAYFHYDYSDIQLQRVVSGGVILFNAAKGKVDGVDLEAQYAVPVSSGHLLLNTGIAYLNARYTDFPNAPLTARNPNGGNISSTGDATGHKMTRSPTWTINLGVDYVVPLGDGELGFNASYYYNDGFFFEPSNRLAQGSYNIVNGQIFYSFGDEQQFKVRLFARNLTDARYYTSATEIAFGDQGIAGAPRTYGVGFDFRFR